MVGDGELQEGQNYEALQAAAHERLAGLTVVVDRNELQSDKPTEEIVAARRPRGEVPRLRLARRVVRRPRLRGAARAFGELARCRRPPAGHRRPHDQGQGRLVHGASGRSARGRRHVPLARGRSRRRELRARVRRARSPESRAARGARARSLSFEPVDAERARTGARGRARVGRRDTRPRSRDEYVVEAYGDALVGLGAERDRPRRARRRPRVRLPGARVRARVPRPLRRVRDRRAGHGVRPPPGWHVTGCCRSSTPSRRFLASRANEQIYNQASERLEGDLRPPLRGADPGRARASRISRCATSRCSQRCRTLDDRAARERARRRATVLRWAVERGRGERRDPARDRAVTAADRARRRARRRARPRPARGVRRRRARVRPRDAARGAHSHPSSSRSAG